MSSLLINLIIALLWCGLVGSAELQHLIVGFVLGYAALWLVRPITGGSYHRKLTRAVGMTFFLLKEIVMATLRVAWEVVTPQRLRHQGIVAVPLDASTDTEITLLANMVTLTPGTLSLDVSEDRSTLYVHAMFGDDPDRVRHEIKHGFERRVLGLLREE
jgi:multicomponent Na+:H+ antiporter subunit E